jgi:hypothetical protein
MPATAPTSRALQTLVMKGSPVRVRPSASALQLRCGASQGEWWGNTNGRVRCSADRSHEAHRDQGGAYGAPDRDDLHAVRRVRRPLKGLSLRPQLRRFLAGGRRSCSIASTTHRTPSGVRPDCPGRREQRLRGVPRMSFRSRVEAVATAGFEASVRTADRATSRLAETMACGRDELTGAAGSHVAWLPASCSSQLASPP